jgi:hypothetical protein
VIWAALRLASRSPPWRRLCRKHRDRRHGARLRPFAAPTIHESLILLQIFMGVVAITTLVLAAVSSSAAGKEAARQGRDELNLTLEAARVGTGIGTRPPGRCAGRTTWKRSTAWPRARSAARSRPSWRASTRGRDKVLRAIRSLEVKDYEIEYRSVCPDGTLRWMGAGVGSV